MLELRALFFLVKGLLDRLVIVAVLVVVTVASLIKTRRDPFLKAHAGALQTGTTSTDNATAEDTTRSSDS